MSSFQENKKFIPQAAPWVKRVCVSAKRRRYLPFRFARCARSCSVWRAKWWMNYSWYSWFLLQANKHLCATGLPEPFHETSGHAPALGLLAFKTVLPDPTARCSCSRAWLQAGIGSGIPSLPCTQFSWWQKRQKKAQGLWWIMPGGEAEGTVCDSFEQREFSVASCVV